MQATCDLLSAVLCKVKVSLYHATFRPSKSVKKGYNNSLLSQWIMVLLLQKIIHKVLLWHSVGLLCSWKKKNTRCWQILTEASSKMQTWIKTSHNYHAKGEFISNWITMYQIWETFCGKELVFNILLCTECLENCP